MRRQCKIHGRIPEHTQTPLFSSFFLSNQCSVAPCVLEGTVMFDVEGGKYISFYFGVVLQSSTTPLARCHPCRKLFCSGGFFLLFLLLFVIQQGAASFRPDATISDACFLFLFVCLEGEGVHGLMPNIKAP